jgi:hypothetical protein
MIPGSMPGLVDEETISGAKLFKHYFSLLSSVVERFFDKEQSMGRYHEEGPFFLNY